MRSVILDSPSLCLGLSGDKNMSLRVGITGANGFIGNGLIESNKKRFDIFEYGREQSSRYSTFRYIDLTDDMDIGFEYIDVFLHFAAYSSFNSRVDLDALNNVNVSATVNLARICADFGVKRFIFLSSVKTLGESTSSNEAYRFDSAYNPQDPYGESKAEAEKELLKIARETGMEVTIIRAPLVYGPGVKANFASLLKLAEMNLPLPLGSVNNARSMVGIQNLVDLIVTCIDHPNAGNQIFMASDGHDVSTSELLKEMTRAFGKKPRLLPFPMSLMSFAARLVGKGAIADRLFGSLRVDIEHTKKTLDWVPKVTLQEELARCVEHMKGQVK